MKDHEHYLYIVKHIEQKQKAFIEEEKYKKQNNKIYDKIVGLREYKKRNYKLNI